MCFMKTILIIEFSPSKMKNAKCKMQRNLAFKNACKSIHICCFEKHAWEQGKLLIKSTHTIVYNKSACFTALCIHHRHYFPKSKGASRKCISIWNIDTLDMPFPFYANKSLRASMLHTAQWFGMCQFDK